MQFNHKSDYKSWQTNHNVLYNVPLKHDFLYRQCCTGYCLLGKLLVRLTFIAFGVCIACLLQFCTKTCPIPLAPGCLSLFFSSSLHTWKQGLNDVELGVRAAYPFTPNLPPLSQTCLPASWQENLTVHLHRRLAPKLAARQVGVVGGTDEIVGQWILHVLVELKAILEDRRILVRHQIAAEAIARHKACGGPTNRLMAYRCEIETLRLHRFRVKSKKKKHTSIHSASYKTYNITLRCFIYSLQSSVIIVFSSGQNKSFYDSPPDGGTLSEISFSLRI